MPDRSANRIHPDLFHVALVFPAVHGQSVGGVPPADDMRAPTVPTPSSFHDEPIDFVLFPEGYVRVQDNKRIRALSRLATALRAPLLVGAVETRPDPFGRLANWQVLLHFNSDGTHRRVYTKHSTADAVAFGEPDWEAEKMLPTFEIGGIAVGATICHDHYLGLLQRFLAMRGAQIWVNPSYDNVVDLKWCLRSCASGPLRTGSSRSARCMTMGEEGPILLVTRPTVRSFWEGALAQRLRDHCQPATRLTPSTSSSWTCPWPGDGSAGRPFPSRRSRSALGMEQQAGRFALPCEMTSRSSGSRVAGDPSAPDARWKPLEAGHTSKCCRAQKF